MRCHVPIGKLISHPCARKAGAKCAACGQAVCERHRSGDRCGPCAGTYAPPKAPLTVTQEELMSFSDEELEAFTRPAAPARLQGHDS